MHRLSKYTLRHEEFLYKSCFFWQHLSSKMIALLIRSDNADEDDVTWLQHTLGQRLGLLQGEVR